MLNFFQLGTYINLYVLKKFVAELVILHFKTILFLEPWLLFDRVSRLQQHHGVHEYKEV
jgi:hypothetical protein